MTAYNQKLFKEKLKQKKHRQVHRAKVTKEYFQMLKREQPEIYEKKDQASKLRNQSETPDSEPAEYAPQRKIRSALDKATQMAQDKKDKERQDLEEKLKEKQEKAKRTQQYQRERLQMKKFVMKKTSRGQPALGSQMNMILKKLENQQNSR